VEWLKVKALSSSLSTEKKKKKRGENKLGMGGSCLWFTLVVQS
jgi:hypothetical protein